MYELRNFLPDCTGRTTFYRGFLEAVSVYTKLKPPSPNLSLLYCTFSRHLELGSVGVFLLQDALGVWKKSSSHLVFPFPLFLSISKQGTCHYPRFYCYIHIHCPLTSFTSCSSTTPQTSCFIRPPLSKTLAIPLSLILSSAHVQVIKSSNPPPIEAIYKWLSAGASGLGMGMCLIFSALGLPLMRALCMLYVLCAMSSYVLRLCYV